MENNYVKKPVTIQAIQLTEGNFDTVCDFVGYTPILVPNKERQQKEDWSLPEFSGIVIPTLEGDMVANLGDYIIRGVKGEYYPCKPDIFELTYNHIIDKMSFGEAINALEEGYAVCRSGWNGKGMFVVKQIPAHITEDIIPKMQSLPQSAKDILMSRENKFIDYTNQMLIINSEGRADSWVPSSSDVFAKDWIIYECAEQ